MEFIYIMEQKHRSRYYSDAGDDDAFKLVPLKCSKQMSMKLAEQVIEDDTDVVEDEAADTVVNIP